jgi:hypothetical protein
MTSTTTLRKSRRGKPVMEIKELGTGNSFVSIDELYRFVNKDIDMGPQIVTLPVPNERHAILVDVQKTKIMISDWGGRKNEFRGLPKKNRRKNPNYEPEWEQYSMLLELLQKKYNLPLSYYEIDTDISDAAFEHHYKYKNSGGCSEYICKWTEKQRQYKKYFV